ncbi:MAG TPA: hypothetical protein VFU31_21185 [Candidatus Binatia bacterium]|nr:hypothetical protein [Candidatus Binatia bacterium]
MSIAYCCLGRLGDIINALPLAWEDSRVAGPVPWIVSREFATVLEGVSYCRPVIYDGEYWDLQGAVRKFKDTFSELRIVQAWSSNYPSCVLGDSFARSAWAQVGRGGWPGRLVFDRRDIDRELRLWNLFHAAHLGSADPILVALDSTSSPFPHRRHLLDLLRAACGTRVWELDPKATRVYDLLGLFERAAALVTVDTMHLHLSWAVPRLPVIALIADHPNRWHGTACRPNQAFRARYKEYPAKAQELMAAVAVAIGGKTCPRLIHCWSDYERSAGAKSRHGMALGSWTVEKNRRHEVWDSVPTSGKGSLFEGRLLHSVKSILDSGLAAARSDDDLLVLTNDDTGFVPGITESLLEVASWPLPACYAHRMDVDRSDGALSSTIDGGAYPGVDLFAMGVRLWKEWRKEFPECVVGAEQWDLAMLALMRRVGAIELPGIIWHQAHHPAWVGPNAHKANQFNRRACGLWFAKLGVTADQVIEGLV